MFSERTERMMKARRKKVGKGAEKKTEEADKR